MCADKCSNELPEYIDVLRLAKANLSLSGKVVLAKMHRLSESLVSNEGEVDVKLHFSQRADGVCYIEGEVQTSLPLLCQRCINIMQFNVDHQFVLAPVRSEAAAKKLPDDVEPVLLPDDEKICLSEMIEDELILQLPIIPKHTETECSVKIDADEPLVGSKAKSDKRKPFANIIALKKKL